MTGLSTAAVAARPAARTVSTRSGAGALPPITVRSTTMLLLNEELARARMREREADAASARLALKVLSARRRQRRAEQAARRARLATVV